MRSLRIIAFWVDPFGELYAPVVARAPLDAAVASEATRRQLCAGCAWALQRASMLALVRGRRASFGCDATTLSGDA